MSSLDSGTAKYIDERLGFLNYVIPKIKENIKRLELELYEARVFLEEHENERKEIINGTKR